MLIHYFLDLTRMVIVLYTPRRSEGRCSHDRQPMQLAEGLSMVKIIFRAIILLALTIPLAGCVEGGGLGSRFDPVADVRLDPVFQGPTTLAVVKVGG